MWFAVVLTLAGFAGFLLGGAALRSLSLGNERAARLCARGSVVLGALAAALAALWLSAVVLWPLEAANVQGANAPVDVLRAPLRAIVASAALGVLALPFALFVLRIIRRRSISSQWRADAGRDDVPPSNARV